MPSLLVTYTTPSATTGDEYTAEGVDLAVQMGSHLPPSTAHRVEKA
ncbi:MAG TPA: hypothetical protein VE915_07560 [Actinomycetota bacterium]|nr:hypothetical protein [Actinomycetota bacterium]